METEKGHIWHKIEPTALLLTVIIVPIVIWWVTSHAEADKTRLEYVRLAIGVLQPSDKDHQPQKELRSWAVQVLQNSSPVKLSPDAVKSLINGDANLPHITYDNLYKDIYGYEKNIEREIETYDKTKKLLKSYLESEHIPEDKTIYKDKEHDKVGTLSNSIRVIEPTPRGKTN